MPESETPKVIRTAYGSNSHKSKQEQSEKEERPKVESVVTSGAVQRKKPLGKRIAETFTGDDARSVGHYVLFDVILPAAKSMIADAASQGVERMLFGDVRGRARPSVGGGAGRNNYTPYNRVAKSEVSTGRREISQRARTVHDFDEIVLAERGEAELVLERLRDLVDEYGSATVSDLYDLVGITGSFTDDKYGWYDLRAAKVIRVRDGHLLDLPATSVIE